MLCECDRYLKVYLLLVGKEKIDQRRWRVTMKYIRSWHLWLIVAITLMPAVLLAEEEQVISELKKGNLEGVRSMIDGGLDVNLQTYLLTLIVCADGCGISLSKDEQLSLLSLLIKKGAKVNSQINDEDTAICYAIIGLHDIQNEETTKGGDSRLPIVKMLLDNGANINFGCKGIGIESYPPLVHAAESGYYQVVDLFLRYGAYKGIDQSLELAIKNHHDQTTKVLRQTIADLDHLRQSTWDLTEMEINGKKVSFKPLRYNFEEGELFTTNSIYKFRIDPTQTPMHLDITGDNETFFGVYEVNGNQLRIAYRFPSSPEGRPKEFTTNPDSKLISMTFRKLMPEIYLPLDEGRTWTYQISMESFLGISGQGSKKIIKTNLAQRALHDKQVIPQKYDISEKTGFLFIARDEKGIYEFAEQDPGSFEPKVTRHPHSGWLEESP